MTESNKSEIPNEAIKALARCLLPAIQTFFESEEGRREFAEWKEQQTEKSAVAESKSLPLAS
ncbi:MAG: hypothetical protein LBD23_03415 [Oscillospiraceae bacterium]|jgi:hypothetical protein|nr:hypothetical protein [Oscillospiraceae bacterium]